MMYISLPNASTIMDNAMHLLTVGVQ